MRSLLRSATYALLLVLTGPALSQEATPDAAKPVKATAPSEGKIALQLNKLEAGKNACNAYVVVKNQSPEALKDLKVDVYLFDKQGIVLQGVALEFTDVGSAGETVVPFELPAVRCDQIGRVLLNKVLACTNASGAPVANCADLLVTSSLADAAFED